MNKKTTTSPSIHFLFGSNSSQKEQYLKRLLSKHPEIDAEFGLVKYDLKNQSLSEIFSQARTLPMGSSLQILRVRVSRKITTPEKKQIVAYAENPAPFSILLFEIMDASLDSKTASKIPGAVVYDSERSIEDPRRLILSELKEADKQITSQALNLFLSKCGGDSQWAASHVEHLVLYTGDRKMITEEDVGEIVPEALSYGSFDLVNALVSKQFDRVLEIFRDALDHGASPGDLMGLIHWQLKRLYEAKRFLLGGTSREVISKKLRIGSYFLNNFLRDVNRFNLADIEKAIEQLALLDFSIKTGKVEGKIGLEKYFVGMTT